MLPHEYEPSTFGHGEGVCKHCRGTNRENAVIAPNGCPSRDQPTDAPASFDEALRHARDGKFYEDYDRAGALLTVLQRAHDAMQRFCDRVEAGDARSRRTYAEFCEILGREPKA